MALTNKPRVLLGVPDNRILTPGFVRNYYPSDPEISKQTKCSQADGHNNDIFSWEGIKMTTLSPIYDPDATEMAMSNFICAGSAATYMNPAPKGFNGANTEAIFQQNPSATNSTVTANFTTDDNQPFYVDFYLGEAFSETWYADLLFCKNYLLRFLYNGTIWLMKNLSMPGDTPNWQYLKSTKTGTKLHNSSIRLMVYPTAHQELFIQINNIDPIVIIDDEPILSTVHIDDGSPDGYDEIIRNICQKSSPQFFVSSGSFYYAYRFMKFKTNGTIVLPQDSLPWSYSGTSIGVDGKTGCNRGNTDYITNIAVTLVDTNGNALTNSDGSLINPPVDNYCVKIVLSSNNNLFTPEINYAQVAIEPNYYEYVPDYALTVNEPGRLLNASINSTIKGDKRDSKIEVWNVDSAYADWWEKQRICTTITNNDTNVLLWKGYLEKTTEAFKQSGTDIITFDGADTLLRLEIPLTDGYIGDGYSDNDFVTEIFKFCGLGPEDYSIDDDPIILPEALGENEPLFQATKGKIGKELIDYICKVWSGKDLYTDMTGVIHYGKIPTTGTPEYELYGSEPVDRTPVGQTPILKYYEMTMTRDIKQFYNYIVVIGLGYDNNPIIATWYDWDSVHTPTYNNYLGCEKSIIVADTSIKTQIQAESSLGFIIEDCGQPLETADLETEWSDTLDVGSIVTVDGYGVTTDDIPPVTTLDNWQVKSLDREWTKDKTARLKLVIRRLNITTANNGGDGR